MSQTADQLELSQYIHSGRARSIRRAAGVTVRSVAGDLGVSPVTVNRWETGKVFPLPSHATAWLGLLRTIDAAVKGMASDA